MYHTDILFKSRIPQDLNIVLNPEDPSTHLLLIGLSTLWAGILKML